MFKKVDSISKATHWLALEQNIDPSFHVTAGRLYKYFKMPDVTFHDDEEYWIIDDEGTACMAYMCVYGRDIQKQGDKVPYLTAKQFVALTEKEKSSFHSSTKVIM